MTENKPNLTISRPKDESFEAYKNWIKDIASNLGLKCEASEEELQAGWKEFWSK
jgi:hypothetical protein